MVKLRGGMRASSDPQEFVRDYIQTLSSVLGSLDIEDLVAVIQLLQQAYQERRYVFLTGNGGSAATALHMANDLLKGVAKDGRHGFRAIALSENIATVTAISNDESYGEVFAGQLAELAQPGDLLIVFSASGNSPNIIKAIEMARQMQLKTIGFLGMGGGKAAKLVDIAVIVPSDDYGPIEDVHLMFDHLITVYFRHWQTVQK